MKISDFQVQSYSFSSFVVNYHCIYFSAFKSHEKLVEKRKFVEEFCTQIRDLCGFGTEMPLRKIEAVSPCLYKGDLKQNYHVVKLNESASMNKIVINKNDNLHLKEKSNMVPSKLNALNVELEITQKAAMSDNMFARLNMAYAIKLRYALWFMND